MGIATSVHPPELKGVTLSDVYEGRLVADGNGNLLAYDARRVGTRTVVVHDVDGEPILDGEGKEVVLEVPVMKFGKNHNKPVVHDTEKDEYVFLKPGEPSHNEQHHQNFVGIDVTQHLDPEAPGYAGLDEDHPTEGHEHHWTKPEDFPPMEQHPDNVAARISGHTHQHKVGDE